MNDDKDLKKAEYPSPWYDQIDAYLAGKLDEDQKDRFEEAFFNDDHLFAEVELRRELKAGFKLGPAPGAENQYRLPAASAMRERHKNRGNGNWRYWGYALVGAAAIIFLVLFKQGLDIPLPGPARQFDLATATLTDLYGPRFSTSPELEPRASAALRSAHSVEVLPPQPLGDPNGTQIIPRPFIDIAGREGLPIMHPGIIFEWRPLAEDAGPLSVIILNNRGDVIGRQENRGNRFTFVASLPAGLYYWSLESPQSTLFVGKFVVPPTTEIREER
ncbi:MAG: hypothetical protein KDI06_16240 [Calditrichaeota bacterium]|nr:hypothetical protein [Calditrichota bacterium]